MTQMCTNYPRVPLNHQQRSTSNRRIVYGDAPSLLLLQRELCRDRSTLGAEAAHLQREQLDRLNNKFVHSEIY